MVLQDLLARAAAAQPLRPAFDGVTGTISYSALNERARRFAQSLIDCGVRPGDRVAIIAGNSPNLAIALWGAWVAGAIAVPLETGLEAMRLKAILENCEPAAIVAVPRELATILDWGSGQACLKAVFATAPPPSALSPPQLMAFAQATQVTRSCGAVPSGIDRDIAVLRYTEVDGGLRAAILTHLNLQSALRSLQRALAIPPDGVILLATPACSYVGLLELLAGLALACTVVLVEPTIDWRDCAELIAEHGASVLAADDLLLDAPVDFAGIGEPSLPGLRLVVARQSAAPRESSPWLAFAGKQTRLACLFEARDCNWISYLPGEIVRLKPGSIGRGMPNEVLRLANPDGTTASDVDCGQLFVRGSHLMVSYWRDASRSAATVVTDGESDQYWVRTAMHLRRDSEGYLYPAG